MLRSILGALVVCTLLVGPTTALAQIAEGCNPVPGSAASLVTAVKDMLHGGGGAYREAWILPAADVLPNAVPRPLTIGTQPDAEEREEGPMLRFEVLYRYEQGTAADLLALADVARQPAGAVGQVYADRVRIEGEVTGWRLRVIADGAVRESWVLTTRYAPPLPVGGDAQEAFAEGWARPYVDAITLEPTPATLVAADLKGLVGPHGGVPPLRLARFGYVPKPVDGVEPGGVCGG